MSTHLTTVQQDKPSRPQTPDWIKWVEPQVDNLVAHYLGSQREQKAQAINDLINEQVTKYLLSSSLIGGYLLYVKARRLYRDLGYSSMGQYITSERVGGIGRTKSYELMRVAMFTSPPNTITAPVLQAPVLNPQSNRLLMTPEFVSEIGHGRAYALTQRWDKETPEGREELVRAAKAADNQAFYNRAYGGEDAVSFEVQGDDILLWQNQVGTKVAQLTTLDPVLRSTLLDRLNTVPRARL